MDALQKQVAEAHIAKAAKQSSKVEISPFGACAYPSEEGIVYYIGQPPQEDKISSTESRLLANTVR